MKCRVVKTDLLISQLPSEEIVRKVLSEFDMHIKLKTLDLNLTSLTSKAIIRKKGLGSKTFKTVGVTSKHDIQLASLRPTCNTLQK